MRNSLWCAVSAVSGAILLAAVPASAAPRPALKVASLAGVPSSLPAGGTLQLRGRVVNLTRSGRLAISLRSGDRTTPLRRAHVRKARSRSFSLRVTIPAATAPGAYSLRVCVRSRCAAERIRITARPNPFGAVAPAEIGGTPVTGRADIAPQASATATATVTVGGEVTPEPTPAPSGLHSLRAPLTGENFYFVMADRFQNGDSSNDTGGIAGDYHVHGFDPTRKGYFHGGDLKGLLSKVDYIAGLGTTAIWLTPSFKNRAVQGSGANESAGYHGYWVTDFTQIDPHFGTNADLRRLVDAAHARGIKVFFDIITNHTADVISYRENQFAYVPKDRDPYRTAAGIPFDDRDYAGTGTFPALDVNASFPYTPYVPAGIESKTPAWLNDLTLYHNRGDTTFTGEDSQYGDFFGLDDLFTEHPRVVDGMIDIYETWIRDMQIDGFRIDTMKHVNDEFWQKFSPDVLAYAKAHGKPNFFMFGEVADSTRPVTSHYTTHNDVQAVLDFPFMEAARGFASKSNATDSLRDFFRDDDYYTDADSNAYQLPTFLGNHDAGHVGMFLRDDNPVGTPESELLARDKLAHALMYLSRGNPVVYFGDEQGFTGAGNDQAARQDMFPSKDLEYDNLGDDAGKNDNIGSDATPMDDNFDPTHPLYKEIAALAQLAKQFPALRDGAQQHRYSETAAGIYAFSRINAGEQREFVVALNNAEVSRSADIPTWMTSATFDRVYGSGGAASVRTDLERRLRVTVPPLSAVVYRARGTVPASAAAPSVAVIKPAFNAEGRDRMEVQADLGGDSFYEVTFYAKIGDDPWEPIGTDDNAPYRVFHDIWDLEPGTTVQYKAVALDNAGHTSESAPRQARVGKPAVSIAVLPSATGGQTEIRVNTTPEHSHYFVTVQRRIGDDGPWTDVGGDNSSPVYIVYDTPPAVPSGTAISYRAILNYGSGVAYSPEPRPFTTALVHYRRPAADYDDWGLHLWGDAIAAGTGWGEPKQRDGIDAYGAYFNLLIQDPTKPVNFIVHRPLGDTVPTTREPGGDRSFVPADHREIWLKQGDATIYYTPPG